MVFQIYKSVFSEFKNLFGRYGRSNDGIYEYYLKLDGYYFCEKRKKTYLIIRVRNKRIVEKYDINSAIKDKHLIQQLHPADACIIGILANNERNHIFDADFNGIKNMRRLKDHRCFVKSNPILRISRKYFDQNKNEITVLYSPCIDKEINITTIDLLNNEALLYAIEPFQAISIGYDVSESFFRKLNAVST